MLRAALTTAFLLASTVCATAQTTNITFDDWEKLSPMVRAAYVAGLLDMIYYDDDDRARMIGRCFSDRTLAAFSDDLLAHARGQSGSYRFKTVYEVMVDYVPARCKNRR